MMILMTMSTVSAENFTGAVEYDYLSNDGAIFENTEINDNDLNSSNGQEFKNNYVCFNYTDNMTDEELLDMWESELVWHESHKDKSNVTFFDLDYSSPYVDADTDLNSVSQYSYISKIAL